MGCFCQAEEGRREFGLSRGLGEGYKGQAWGERSIGSGGKTRGKRKLSVSRTSGKGLGELNVRDNFKLPASTHRSGVLEPTLGEQRVYI